MCEPLVIMKICFVTNSLTKKDDLTTYDLAVAALARKHEVYFLSVMDFFSENNNIFGNLRKVNKKVEKRGELAEIISKTSTEKKNLRGIDLIFLRHKYKSGSKIIENYHKLAREYAVHLLEEGIKVINDPRYLHFMSSKIATHGIDSSILPKKQLVSNNIGQLLDYCKNELNFEGVIKPMFGSGGEGIFFIDRKNLRNNLKTNLEKGPVIMQSYIPNEGDKRIIVLGGNPVAWYMRVAAEGELLNNIHAGGSPVKCDLSERDKLIVSKLKPKLVKYGMHLVGVDTLGGYLSEINTENPGGTVRADMLGNFYSRNKIIEYIEALIK